VLRIAALIAVVPIFFACQQKDSREPPTSGLTESESAVINWDRLRMRTVFFQHKSVGQDLLDGVRLISNEEGNADAIVIGSVAGRPGGDGLMIAEATTGQNGDPLSKIAGFEKVLSSDVGKQLDVAMMKFCYRDVTAETNVEALFQEYKSAMSRVKEAAPGLSLVHVTVPLMVQETSWKTVLKQSLGSDTIWEFQDNAARGRFNELIRAEYLGVEPVFDIARLESTASDGKRELFVYRGKEFEALLPQYSTDGGHLNETGKRVIGRNFLAFISSIE
jgi:hypothetical protein